ncbi:DUF3870 domain-containing protein [Savagea serpentis]|nr:DUF3870 domain-containing protein [Savagea serpentis]
MRWRTIDTVLVTAYSKAPQGSAMYERFKHSGLVLEIEKETHLIRNVEFTFVTKLAQQYLEQLVVGANFHTDLEFLIERIQQHFLAPSQQSIIVALKNAHQRFVDEVIKK